MTSANAVFCVWRRYFAIYRKNYLFGLITTFVEPALYLLSFGFGVGGMIGAISVGGQDLTYRQFVFAGIVTQTIMFQGFFEAAYGGFVRMYYQKIFKAIAKFLFHLNLGIVNHSLAFFHPLAHLLGVIRKTLGSNDEYGKQGQQQ